jgi:hypothetical protein
MVEPLLRGVEIVLLELSARRVVEQPHTFVSEEWIRGHKQAQHGGNSRQ